jgi:integrase
MTLTSAKAFSGSNGLGQLDGEIAPKRREGRRTVRLAGVLREILVEDRLSQGRGGNGLVFGRTATTPFGESGVRERARRAWEAAGLERMTLHECRHTFATLMIAAGVNTKALSRYRGHFSIVITLDLYGHLMPGNEDEAAGMLHAYPRAA